MVRHPPRHQCLLIVIGFELFQSHFGPAALSHPDNALEACALLTPLHIVPEWYFLCQYALLKAIPNKNAGVIVLLTSILILFYFGEIRNISTFSRLNKNSFALSSFFLTFIVFIWIGAQFPQEKFISYARVLTFFYYFLIFNILLTFFTQLL